MEDTIKTSMEPEKTNEEKIKTAFSLVKEDIKDIKKELLVQKREFSEIKKRIEVILNDISEKKENKDFLKSSIGNEGVVNNQQQSTVVNNQQPTINTLKKGVFDASGIQEALQEVDQVIAHKVQSLTDREFSVFAAIVENEAEALESTYTSLADRLGLSESTVRGVANRILTKGLPVVKSRFLHKKASLALSHDLKEVYTLKKLLFLRQHSLDQKTLSIY